MKDFVPRELHEKLQLHSQKIVDQIGEKLLWYKKEIEKLNTEMVEKDNHIQLLRHTIEEMEDEGEEEEETPEDEEEKPEVHDKTEKETNRVMEALTGALGIFGDGILGSQQGAKDQTTPQKTESTVASPPGLDESTVTEATKESASANILKKAFEKTPKPVNMPTGPLPNANTLGFWIAQLAGNLSAASIYTTYEEYEWIHEARDKSFIDLLEPGERLAKLDQLLQVAATKILTRELQWEYQQRVEEMAVLKRPVSGRQVVWIIINATKSSEADALITSYENLKEIPWYGDGLYSIVEFYWEWIRLRKNMAKDVSEDTIRNILFDKMQKQSKAFDEDAAHYLRCKDKSTKESPNEDYSLKFLESCLYRHVTKKIGRAHV